MDAVPPTASTVLDRFFAEASPLRHPSMRGRVPDLRAQLEGFLEEAGAGAMTTAELTLLAAERQMHPGGAVVRILSPAALLAVLGRYLEPRCLPRDHTEASARVRLVAALRPWVVAADPAVTGTCDDLELTAALSRARRFLALGRRPSGGRV